MFPVARAEMSKDFARTHGALSTGGADLILGEARPDGMRRWRIAFGLVVMIISLPAWCLLAAIDGFVNWALAVLEICVMWRDPPEASQPHLWKEPNDNRQGKHWGY